VHFTNSADWGTAYLDRAAATEYLQFGNNEAAAGYWMAFKDGAGQTLNGALHSYTLTFPAGDIPQAKRFWSVTAYVPRRIELVPNAAKKYLVASYTPGLGDHPGRLHHDHHGADPARRRAHGELAAGAAQRFLRRPAGLRPHRQHRHPGLHPATDHARALTARRAPGGEESRCPAHHPRRGPARRRRRAAPSRQLPPCPTRGARRRAWGMAGRVHRSGPPGCHGVLASQSSPSPPPPSSRTR